MDYCKVQSTISVLFNPSYSGTSSLNKLHRPRLKQRNQRPFVTLRGSAGPQEPVVTTEPEQRSAGVVKVDFQTMRDCRLGISRYPDFVYNAEGGRGSATGTLVDLGGQLQVAFDVGSLYIPPLGSATTRFLGLPLPPFLRIDVVPELLEGVIDRGTGKVELEFTARFLFSVGTVYRAPPLLVVTRLTSEESRGSMRGGTGKRLDSDGRCTLVGVAVVDPIRDVFMDSFLALPTECLAVLNATIVVDDPS